MTFKSYTKTYPKPHAQANTEDLYKKKRSIDTRKILQRNFQSKPYIDQNQIKTIIYNLPQNVYSYMENQYPNISNKHLYFVKVWFLKKNNTLYKNLKSKFKTQIIKIAIITRNYKLLQ